MSDGDWLWVLSISAVVNLAALYVVIRWAVTDALRTARRDQLLAEEEADTP